MGDHQGRPCAVNLNPYSPYCADGRKVSESIKIESNQNEMHYERLSSRPLKRKDPAVRSSVKITTKIMLKIVMKITKKITMNTMKITTNTMKITIKIMPKIMMKIATGNY